MTMTEMIRSIGAKFFFPFVALCIVGVFSSVSFAEEAPHSAPPGKIERAGQATGTGIERGAKATERGVKRAGEATGIGIKKAGEAIEKTFSGED